MVVNGYRSAAYEWAEVVAVTLRPGARGRCSTSPTARRSPRWASRAPTVRAPPHRSDASVPSSPNTPPTRASGDPDPGLV